MAEFRYGRIYVTRHDAERLDQQIWVFDRQPQNLDPDCRTVIRLRAYLHGTRATRRHKFTGPANASWSVSGLREDREAQLPAANVPLPNDVRDEALALARDLVTLVRVI